MSSPKREAHYDDTPLENVSPSRLALSEQSLFITVCFIFSVVIVCNCIEGIDLQLIPSAFKAFEALLGVGPMALSQLSLAQAISQCLAGPIWGYIADNYSRMAVLSFGVFSWGIVSIIFSLSSSFWEMLVLRALIGITLASISPTCQSLVADLYPETNRGKAYGQIQLCLCLGMMFGTVLSTSLSQQTFFKGALQGWRVVFFLCGSIAVITSIIIKIFAYDPPRGTFEKKNVIIQPSAIEIADMQLSLCKRLRSYLPFVHGSWARWKNLMPRGTLVILLIEGTLGYIPLSAFSFCTFYFQYVGFADFLASALTATILVGGALGGLFGGYAGDIAAQWHPSWGRPMIGFLSCAMAAPIMYFGLHIIPRTTDAFLVFLLTMIVLGFSSSWSSPGVNRPTLAELVPAQSRARVFATMVAIEGSVASCLGAPAVGFIAEKLYGYRVVGGGAGQHDPHTAQLGQQVGVMGGKGDLQTGSMDAANSITMSEETRNHNVSALANSLTIATCFPWAVCALLYLVLQKYYARDRKEMLKSQRGASYKPVHPELGNVQRTVIGSHSDHNHRHLKDGNQNFDLHTSGLGKTNSITNHSNHSRNKNESKHKLKIKREKQLHSSYYFSHHHHLSAPVSTLVSTQSHPFSKVPLSQSQGEFENVRMKSQDSARMMNVSLSFVNHKEVEEHDNEYSDGSLNHFDDNHAHYHENIQYNDDDDDDDIDSDHEFPIEKHGVIGDLDGDDHRHYISQNEDGIHTADNKNDPDTTKTMRTRIGALP